MAEQPSIPKGTRDFGQKEMTRRNYIFNTIREVFQLYGYLPIETPAMENLSTLLGKYGDEGDKLLFKILNSGDFVSALDNETLTKKESNNISLKICEKGLRYDLTVPFARYVVQHRNEITFPFKRSQIQAVWRADRPQKGRYREFYQCDADIVGSNSLLNEYELIQLIAEVFQRLKINVTIKINNRKILAGIAEVLQETDKLIDITVAIDKIDKIGQEKVIEELLSKGISENAIEKLNPLFIFKGNSKEKIEFLKKYLSASTIGLKGIEEIETVFNYTKHNLDIELELDITLARGLNYYTGAIFEVKSKDVQIGSISGGGRYDDLTGIFGLKDISGVGISFGADRIYDVMEQLGVFPEYMISSVKVLVANFGEKETEYCFPVIQQLRKSGISTELYPETSKLKKQLSYADTKGIPYIVMAGENEINEKKLTIKNMVSGEQKLVTLNELISYLES